jgi:uncharacterized delta-60 repeat protein
MKKFYLRLLSLFVFLSAGQGASAQAVDPSFSAAVLRYGTVSSAATLPNGQVVLLGNQLYTNGSLTGSLVRLLPSGELDEAFFQRTGMVDCGTVDEISPYRPLVRAYPDGGLLLVGPIVAPQASGAVLRLLPSGEADPAFVLPPDVKLPSIRTAAIQADGKVLLAGIANRYSGAPCLLRLNADGSLDPTFSAALTLTSADYVQTLAVQPDGRILVAGHFAQPATGLVRLLPSGAHDPSFQPQVAAGGIVEEVLCRPSGRILVAGRSTLTLRGRKGSVQQLLPDGQLDTTFDPTPTAAYSLIRVGDNRRLHLLPGGRVCVLPVAPAPAAVFLLPNGQLDPARPALTNWPLSSLAAATPDSAGQLVLSGTYRHRGGPPSNLVRLLPTGRLDAGFRPQLCQLGTVRSLLEQPGLGVLLAGSFDLVNGTPTPNLARLLPGTSTVDTAFSRRIPRLSPLDVLALHQPANYFVASGFQTVNERSWSGVIRLYPDGRLDTLFRRWPGGYASSSLAVRPDGRVLVAGPSSQAVGVLLANGDADQSFVLAQSTSLGTPVRLLAQPDGRALLLGSSQSVRVQADGRYDPTFTPTVLNRYGNLLPEAAVLQPNGRITLCGQMPPDATNTRNGVIRLLPDGQRDASLANILPGYATRPRALCYQPDGGLWVGASFYNYNTSGGAIGLWKYLADGQPDPDFQPLPGVGDVYSLLRISTGQVLVGGYFAQADLGARQPRFSLLALLGSSPLANAAPAATAATAVYPNPVPPHHQVQVRLDATRQPRQVQLLDTPGRVLLTHTIAAPLATLTLNAQGLPAGTYLLRVDYELGSAQTRRVVLE